MGFISRNGLGSEIEVSEDGDKRRWKAGWQGL